MNLTTKARARAQIETHMKSASQLLCFMGGLMLTSVQV